MGEGRAWWGWSEAFPPPQGDHVESGIGGGEPKTRAPPPVERMGVGKRFGVSHGSGILPQSSLNAQFVAVIKGAIEDDLSFSHPK